MNHRKTKNTHKRARARLVQIFRCFFLSFAFATFEIISLKLFVKFVVQYIIAFLRLLSLPLCPLLRCISRVNIDFDFVVAAFVVVVVVARAIIKHSLYARIFI